MSIYTFYSCKPDGAPTAFEAYDLENDDAATGQAQVLLEQHMSAARIDVFDHDRAVLTLRRRSVVA